MSIIALLVAAVLVGIDQLIKYLVVANLPYGATQKFLPGFLNFTHITNDGAAFGMFRNQDWLLIGATLLIILGGIVLLLSRKVKNPFLLWSVCLIVAGGAGNLIDRMARNKVIDYLDLDFAPFKNFPIFNFADCLVVIGAILLMVYVIFGDKYTAWRKKKEKVKSGSTESMGNEADASEHISEMASEKEEPADKGEKGSADGGLA